MIASASNPVQAIASNTHTMDNHGGVWLPGVLVADTLDELRAMMLAGLTRRDRVPIDSEGVVETWD